jgi:protein subunit release factor B
MKEIGFGSQIRSYVLQPYKVVKAHRNQKETHISNEVKCRSPDLMLQSPQN